MQKLLVVVIFFVLLPSLAFGRQNAQYYNFKAQTNVIPPSPNAAALAKYVEVPVNLSTGIPQISVPIFDWKSSRGHAAVAVSLSYHAGGIKVEDFASSTGLGWSLVAGGTITRSVRGLPDEDGAFGYLAQAPIPNYNTTINTGDYYLNPPTSIDEYATMDTSRLNILAHFNDPGGDITRTYNFYQGTFDTEQDIFYYNVAGFSGSFVIDKDEQVTKLDDNDLVITVQFSSYPAIAGFTIQLDNGIKCLFDVTEISSSMSVSTQSNYNYSGVGAAVNEYYPTPIPQEHFSSYHLSKMIDLNSADTIFFEYTERTISTCGSWSEFIEYHENNDPSRLYYVVWPEQTFNTANYIRSHGKSYVVSETQTKNLRRIVLPNKSDVKFYYDIGRIDLPGDSALTRIEINDGFGNVKRYMLRYNYFDAAAVANSTFLWITPFPFSANHFQKRLRLDKIQQVSAWTNGDSLLINSFVYNDTLLPPRNSKEADHWGYYYGPYRYAYTTIPQIHPAIIENPTTEGPQPYNSSANLLNMFTEGANRTPDLNYGRAAILKRINMPTGGYTQFQFETNRVAGQLFHNSYYNYTRTYSAYSNIGQKKIIDFVGRSSTEVMFFVAIRRVNSNGTDYVPPPPGNGPVGCFDDAVEMSDLTFYVESTDGTVNKSCAIDAVTVGELTTKIYFSLPTGKNYRLYFSYNELSDPCLADVYFDINTSIRYISDANQSLVGGQRIAKIEYVDPLASKTVASVYKYVKSDNSSSGVIPVIPNYSSNVTADGKWSCCPWECEDPNQPPGSATFPTFLGYAKFKSRTSTTRQTLSYSGGSNISYQRVVHGKEDASGVNLGYTISQFDDPVVMNESTVFPYKPTQTLNWAGGKLWREEVFDRDNITVKRTDYTYNVISTPYNNEKNRSVKIACIRTDECMTVNPLPYIRLVAFSYYPYHGKANLASKREVDFVGSDSLITISEYSYFANTDHLAWTRVTNLSKGETVVSQNRYPTEYTHPGMQKLATNKVTGEAVSSFEFIQEYVVGVPNKELSASAVDFAVSGNYARKSVFSRLNTADPNTQTTFNPAAAQQSTYVVAGRILQYDSYGNVCEIEGEDGVVRAIIWGYQYTRPIAEVTGATYAQAISKFTTTSITAIQSITDMNTVLTKLAEVRDGFVSNPTVQVKTFTHRPLIGITSVTDARGRNMFFEYDAFGRLVIKRDHNGDVLERICYKYYNEGDNCAPACVNTSPDWQASGESRCQTNGNGQNTGYLENKQVDVNPCSATYNQVQWIQGDYNLESCPLPVVCNSSNCTGNDKKCINGVCETGTWVPVSSVRIGKFEWQCQYKYCFSDGTYSTYSQTITQSSNCLVLICGN